MPNYANCLRPAFTQIVYEKLKRGDSLNVIGGKGMGRSRLLNDVATAAFEEGIFTMRVNLSAYKFNYQGFLDEVNRQQFNRIEQPKQVLELNAGDENGLIPFAASLSPTISNGQRQVFLLFDDFDRILDNRQQHFPQQFFDDLNALKNQANVSICCITEKAHNLYKVYYKTKEKALEDRLSWLDLQLLDLDPFLLPEIKAEMGRQLQHNENWQQEKHIDTIAKAVLANPKPTLFKDYLVSNYPLNHAGSNNTPKWLKQCKRNFKRHHPQKTWLGAYVGDGIDWVLNRLLKVSEIFKNVKGDK